jgi:hypothetical protein
VYTLFTARLLRLPAQRADNSEASYASRTMNLRVATATSKRLRLNLVLSVLRAYLISNRAEQEKLTSNCSRAIRMWPNLGSAAYRPQLSAAVDPLPNSSFACNDEVDTRHHEQIQPPAAARSAWQSARQQKPSLVTHRKLDLFNSPPICERFHIITASQLAD